MPLDLEIDEIVIKDRVRKDLGDINQLALSIDEIGLLHPIVVYKDEMPLPYKLLAGRRRIAAFEKLGKKVIPATVLNLTDTLKAELHENSVRKDFAFSEMRQIMKEMKPILDNEAKEHMSAGGRGANLAPLEKGKTRDKLASLMGISHGTYDKIEEISDAIDNDPEKYGRLEEQIEGGTSIDYAYKSMKTTKRATTPTPNMPDGEFELIYLDPPWEYDFKLSGAPPYKTMTLEEMIEVIHPPSYKDCVMFMWCTNPKLTDGIALLEHWGFTYKTNIAWVKWKNDKIQRGTGYYVQGSHELLLIAVKGSPGVPPENVRVSSVVFAERTAKHSEKPAIFYQIIEKYYPAKTKIEMFARERRDGWTSWGDGVVV